MNRSPAASRLAEIRARAWYALAECNHFVDFTQTMFAASSVGRLAVRGGRHAFTAPALAVLTYAFAGRGLARLSRAYSSLAEEELGGLLAHPHAVDRSESLPARAAPAASARAIAHLLLLCGRLCRGELGAAHEAALQYDVQAGLRAAKQAGDPQRQWLILRVAGFALLFTGRLRGYSALSDFLVDNARISRRYHVASVCRDLASGWLADVTGEPDQSIQAFGRVVEVAGLAGSRLEVLAARARKNFLLALHASRSQPVEGVTNEARTISAAWLKGGFATCADWPLAQCFAALVLQYGHAPSVGPTLSSLRAARRACARQCRGNRVETPLYLAACAGLHLLAGKRDRARRVFEHAVYTARSEGMLMQLLDVYRVAARLYPEGDPDKEWYANAATQLAREMGRAPSSPLEALLDGSLGARLTTAS